ncbi:BMP family ABC transporter substrate-binding protein [Egicoccus sp. AB-alg6-2]|uniref:BMP family ABC transporter substrate-binding protein n=1 Tax=Egicoccus sp. AB-alg6-2 TaxID=3242692 RepID=UPI00359DCD65
MRLTVPFRAAAFAVLVLATAACGAGTPAPATTPAAAPATSAVDLTREAGGVTADADLGALCRERFGDIEVERVLRVGLITDSGDVRDGSFNQFAYEGMQAAARCFGFETSYIASGTSENEAHLRELVEEGMDAVITVGFPLAAATATVAASHPDVQFIGVDQVTDYDGDNYARVTFSDDQAGFLAGAVAGMLTGSGIVGVVAGPDDIPPVVALADGFEAGVASLAADVTVLREHLDSFSDQEGGAAQADEFAASGADVIYAPAGLTGSGAILHAAQQGHWVIGVDQDQYLTTFQGGGVTGSDRIVTSTVKRVDLGVFLQLVDVAAGAFRGGPVVMDAATGGVTYAPAHEAAIPEDVHTRLEEIRAGLASGELQAASSPGGDRG